MLYLVVRPPSLLQPTVVRSTTSKKNTSVLLSFSEEFLSFQSRNLDFSFYCILCCFSRNFFFPFQPRNLDLLPFFLFLFLPSFLPSFLPPPFALFCRRRPNPLASPSLSSPPSSFSPSLLFAAPFSLSLSLSLSFFRRRSQKEGAAAKKRRSGGKERGEQGRRRRRRKLLGLKQTTTTKPTTATRKKKERKKENGEEGRKIVFILGKEERFGFRRVEVSS